MHPAIDTKRPSLVEAEVQAAYNTMFPQGNPFFVPTVFEWVLRWFSGRYGDYQAIDAHYHDLEHTLQGLLCMTRILRNRHTLGIKPVMPQRTMELGVLAILMHDTGYLKKRDDSEGTGAKYTPVHVDRSLAFASEFMASEGYSARDIQAVRNMIRCTGVTVNLEAIPFDDVTEALAGHALGTADLLGQMAAPDYVEKLPVLYSEFAEAAAFNADKMRPSSLFASAEDLMQKTPAFWERFVLPKLEQDFGGLYRVLNEPFPDGPNAYIELINSNIARVRQMGCC